MADGNGPAPEDDRAATPLEALETRRSVRAFLPDPVPRAVVERILTAAARAPSGTNMQPWRVHVVAGAARQRLCDAVLHAFDHNDPGPEMEYKYYPDEFFEPYRSRRKEIGVALYGLLGIAKGDMAAMHRQHGRNYLFFDAPVGMIVTLDRRLEIGSWLDCGAFLQGIMTGARQFGLHTCPQAAWAAFPTVVRRELGIDDGQTVVCGMALGYEDKSAPENALRTPRAPLSDWASFDGWDDRADGRPTP